MLTFNYIIDDAGVKAMLAQFPGRINGALSRGVQLAAEMLEGRVVGVMQETHADTGRGIAFGYLVNSIHAIHEPGSLHALVDASPPADKYAAPVETGSRSHWIPVSAIPALTAWVIKKGLVGKENMRFEARRISATLRKAGLPTKLARGMSKKMSIDSEAEKIAWAIRGSIAKYGIVQGVWMFQQAYLAGKADAETLIDAEIQKAVQGINEGNFTHPGGAV